MTEKNQQLSTTEVSAEPGAAILEQIEALKGCVQAELKDVLRAQKALEALSKGRRLASGEALQKAQRELGRASLAVLGADAEREAIVLAIDGHVERQKKALRMQFLAELQTLATADGLEVVRLAESPPTLYLHPLTIELDFERETAALSYSREPVEEAALRPGVVLKCRQQIVDRMRDEAKDSQAFFDLLKRAYQTVLIARGEQAGARVDLVDLLVPLALLRVDHAQWRKSGVDGLKSYPRHMLSYQLNRLRRDGLLERNGSRIDLGTATGGSTKNKRDVLFVATAQTEGQYYLSIRFS
ncbi:MAG: hypothetical protein H0U74_00020 [Bradymonadaceae bacterium]|nr:hypothetical protein [Lujinxingiaceae bacterium]